MKFKELSLSLIFVRKNDSFVLAKKIILRKNFLTKSWVFYAAAAEQKQR